MKLKKYSLAYQLYENLGSGNDSNVVKKIDPATLTDNDNDPYENDPSIKNLRALHELNKLSTEAEEFIKKEPDQSIKDQLQTIIDDIAARKRDSNKNNNFLTQEEIDEFYNRYSKIRNEYNKTESESTISISHRGMKLIFSRDVIKMCTVKESFVKSIISKLFRGGSTTNRRINNTINFIINVIDYSFEILKKRGLNIEKIKKTVSNISVEMQKKDSNVLGSYSDNTGTLILYILDDAQLNIEPETLEYSYDLTIKNYAETFVHELGHGIDFKYLSVEARRFWLSGWKNLHKNITQNLTDREGFIKSSYAGYVADTGKTQKHINYLKQSSINEFLKKFHEKLMEYYNSNTELQDYYDYLSISSKDPKTIKTEKEKIEYTEAIRKSLSNFSKEDGINTFEKIASSFEEYKNMERVFTDPNLNIFKEEYLVKVSVSLMNLYIMGLCEPEALRNVVNKNEAIRRPDIYKAEALFRDVLNISPSSSDEEILDKLLTKVFIAPGNVPFDFNNKSSVNPADLPAVNMQSHFTNYDLDFENAIDSLKTPTKYSQRNYQEDFAETFKLYILYPDRLSDVATYRMERTLWLSGFTGKNLREALLRRLVRLMLEGLNRRKRTPASRLI